MEDFRAFVAFVAWTVFASSAGLLYGNHEARKDVMKEAYERNVAVQCVGLKGYYWECPTESK